MMLKKRFFEIIPIVVVIILSIALFEKEGFLLLIIGFSILGQIDLYNLLEKNSKFAPLKLVGILIGVLIILTSYYGNLSNVTELFITSIIILSLLCLGNHNVGKNYVPTLLGIIYVPLLLQFYTLLLNQSQSIWFVLWFLIVTKSTDSFAYLIGSYFGKSKLIAHISPNKTVEGAVGGILIAVVIGTLLYKCLAYPTIQITPFKASILALCVAILSTLSELFESSIKRWAQVKDSSKKQKASGGMLDKIDSCLFIGIFAYLFFNYFVKIS